MKRFGLFLLAVMLLMACTDKKGEFVRPNDRSAFVTLTDAVPDAILEIRYFSTYNFVGTRIDGYEEPTALLTKQAADSLQVVSKEVMKMGYRLKIYDAYRPQTAVDHFVRWSKDVNDSLMKRYFYPQLEKDVLDAYNALRRKSDKSPMEAYESVAASLRLKSWQVQYIVIKARKTGKEVI